MVWRETDSSYSSMQTQYFTFPTPLPFSPQLGYFASAHFFVYFPSNTSTFHLSRLMGLIQLYLFTTATLGTDESGHWEVAVVERLKQEWMYGLSAKKKSSCKVGAVVKRGPLVEEDCVHISTLFSNLQTFTEAYRWKLLNYFKVLIFLLQLSLRARWEQAGRHARMITVNL